jgi:hypothetical protein
MRRGERTRTHQTRESLERSWDSDSRVDFDENAFCCLDVNLQSASFVQRRVEERQEALWDSVQVSNGYEVKTWSRIKN